MSNELVLYSRTFGCPLTDLVKETLKQHAIPYREVFIDRDDQAKERVGAWTGFQSVPTLIVAETGADTPVAPPIPLATGHSPRGIDRGAMITEPNTDQLTLWLQKHGFITSR